MAVSLRSLSSPSPFLAPNCVDARRKFKRPIRMVREVRAHSTHPTPRMDCHARGGRRSRSNTKKTIRIRARIREKRQSWLATRRNKSPTDQICSRRAYLHCDGSAIVHLLRSTPLAFQMVQPWTLIDDDDKNCYSGAKEVIKSKSVV